MDNIGKVQEILDMALSEAVFDGRSDNPIYAKQICQLFEPKGEVMLESEEKRKRLIEIITRWCEYTKALPLLRSGDILALVRGILGEFYYVSLCCGHLVKSADEGVALGFYNYADQSSIVEGIYCKECAKKYKKKLGAWEIKASNKDKK